MGFGLVMASFGFAQDRLWTRAVKKDIAAHPMGAIRQASMGLRRLVFGRALNVIHDDAANRILRWHQLQAELL